ncbi:serine O-acetyltransferase EpsC [Candidatus Epulonipiscium viviparus]|uniref:serine O-acetyltransferase EpsC n=1 Tax=Candidatus Epulonipiscium viviparus TaxID=420336 RepID=UPI00273810C3|nr:serine O-acetyltransferase EpsC [Candidatus Epulopiscium viviparus]
MLDKMLAAIQEVIKTYKKKDPAAKSTALLLLAHPGVHAVAMYRVSHLLWKNDFRFMAGVVSYTARFLTGIEIHPGAVIGKRLFIDHGMGIVIGETAVIGNDVMIFHQVTLGGTGKQRGKRHPTIGDNVMLSAGSKIIGNVVIAKNSKVGANAVVLGDVPANATVIGCPAKIVKLDGDRVEIPIESKTTKK